MTRFLSLLIFLWATLSVQGQLIFACGSHADMNAGESRTLHHSDTGFPSHSSHYGMLEYKDQGQPAGSGSPCHKSCCTQAHAAQCDSCMSAPVVYQDTKTTPVIPKLASYPLSFHDDSSAAFPLAGLFAHNYHLPVYLATSRLRF